MSEESIILLEDISSSQADNKSVVQAVVSPSPFNVPEGKVAGERGEETPVGGPDGPNEVGVVCETEAGREADVKDEDEVVDVVCGVDEFGSLGTSLTVSLSQKPFVERDLRRRMCPRVSVTPLTFHNVSFQIFNIYH